MIMPNVITFYGSYAPNYQPLVAPAYKVPFMYIYFGAYPGSIRPGSSQVAAHAQEEILPN